MSLTISKAEGVTVFTVTSNPKSKWPLICQILATMCCSPVCFVSQNIKQQLGKSHTALGTLQILVGFIQIGFAAVISSLAEYYSDLWSGGIYGFASVFIVTGILCILAEKFSSPCLLSFTVLVNLVSTALAITTTVLLSADMYRVIYRSDCYYGYEDEYNYRRVTSSSERIANRELCLRNEIIMKRARVGLDIMMIVLSVLQLCVTISSCVLILKALCKKNRGEETNDPELYKPLVEEGLASPAC